MEGIGDTARCWSCNSCGRKGSCASETRVSGQFLLTPEELASDRLAERAARETAEARVAELEAELRRLRGE